MVGCWVLEPSPTHSLTGSSRCPPRRGKGAPTSLYLFFLCPQNKPPLTCSSPLPPATTPTPCSPQARAKPC